jgi:hypothetical protein
VKLFRKHTKLCKNWWCSWRGRRRTAITLSRCVDSVRLRLAKANAKIEYLTSMFVSFGSFDELLSVDFARHVKRPASHASGAVHTSLQRDRLLDEKESETLWTRIDIECGWATEDLQIATGCIEQLHNRKGFGRYDYGVAPILAHYSI